MIGSCGGGGTRDAPFNSEKEVEVSPAQKGGVRSVPSKPDGKSVRGMRGKVIGKDQLITL